jgi:transposase
MAAAAQAFAQSSPREDILLDVEDMVWACITGTLHTIGKAVSHMPDWVPAQLRVVRITRQKVRTWSKGSGATAPDWLIADGQARSALISKDAIQTIANPCPAQRRP